MLLAAIEALIDGHEYLANYHMAWFAVSQPSRWFSGGCDVNTGRRVL